jgi:DNA topoisomerase-3
MRLWIAEKPDAGRKIAAALGGGSNDTGCIRIGRSDVVTWAFGHLFENFMPHDYDERWKKWNLDDLPIVPKRFQNRPEGDKRAQVAIISKLIGQAKEIVIAADAAREGEYIAWEILDHAGWKGPCKRFWTSALNPDGIAKAVQNLIDDAEKKPMYIAAKLRSAIDWSDGVNFSRAYNLRISTYGDRVLSVGRVQTATLAILVDRDLEIENFVPRDYFELKAVFDLPEGRLELMHSPPEEKRIATREAAEAIAAKTARVPTTLKVEQKPRTMGPPIPFNLTELSKAAGSRWGWGTKKTLDVAQQLYEQGSITYPRTSSGYLNEVMKNDMPQHMAALRKIPAYAKFAEGKPVIRSAMFNDKKIEDHHGIIPTTQIGNVAALGSDAQKLFDIIARRYLAAMMPDAKGFTTTISTVIEGYPFKTSGLTITDPGWKAVWGKEADPDEGRKGKDEDETRLLPPVKNGTRSAADPVEVVGKVTKPPPHYTEATLGDAMEKAGKKSDDEDIRDVIGEMGIGTVATRPDMIEKLKFRGFASIDGKKIISTRRGREFISIIREDGNRLADVSATAFLEKEMRAVEKDPSKAADIWREYARNLREEIDKLKRTRPRRKLTPDPQPKGRSSGYTKAPSRGGGRAASTSKGAPRAAKSGGAKTGTYAKKGAAKSAGTGARKTTRRAPPKR